MLYYDVVTYVETLDSLVEMIECSKYGKLRAGYYENESRIFFGTDPIQEFQDFFLILQFCQVFGILAIVLMPKGLM